jgi:hypothetical protein
MNNINDIINYLLSSQEDILEAINEYPKEESPDHLEGQLFAVDEMLSYLRELRDNNE